MMETSKHMNEQPQHSMFSERNLNFLLVVLPVLTGGLYLLGTAYHSGRLTEFGLSDEVFPLVGEKSLLTGFFSFLRLSAVGLGYGVLAAVSLVIFAVGAQILTLSSRVRAIGAEIHRVFKKDNVDGKGSDKPAAAGDNLIKNLLKYLGVAVVLVFVAIIASWLSAWLGQSQARDEKAKYAAHKVSVTRAIDRNNAELLSGYLIACSDKFCAFWTGEQSVVIPVEDIRRMESSKLGNARNENPN
jgi:hypothetical protein